MPLPVPDPIPVTARRALATVVAAAALGLSACAGTAADPVSSAVAVAEARCECTRQHAPHVAACVNQAANDLYRITTALEDGPTRTAATRAYEDAFRQCPWDDPAYYR